MPRNFSSFVERIGGEGAAAWTIHYRALERQRRGEDVILLSVGEPDFDTPAPVVEAAVASLRRGRTHYGDIVGEPALREAVARFHEETVGQAVDPDQVVVMAGAQCALFAAALCLLDAGEEVIVPEPMYVTYEAVVGASGARLVRIPLRAEHGFQLDPADLAAAVTSRTRALLLNTPHNPTGAVLPRATLEAVAEICRRQDLWLISDEVYARLAYDRPHVSPAGLPGMAERTVVVNSLSKSHAMTGWRLGWAVAPAPLVPHLANLALCMLYGCPPFVQDAAVTALSLEAGALEGMRVAYDRRRCLVRDALAGLPGLVCRMPEGGMFAMIDVRGTGLSAYAFADGLLERQAVAALAGEAFGPSAAGHIRMSLGLPDALLAEACRRIAAHAASLVRAA